MDIWHLLIVGLALWFGFQWGKHYGSDKDEKAKRLLDQAEQESDPQNKTKLLLAWYGLVGNRRSRTTLRERLMGRNKKEPRR